MGSPGKLGFKGSGDPGVKGLGFRQSGSGGLAVLGVRV